MVAVQIVKIMVSFLLLLIVGFIGYAGALDIWQLSGAGFSLIVLLYYMCKQLANLVKAMEQSHKDKLKAIAAR